MAENLWWDLSDGMESDKFDPIWSFRQGKLGQLTTRDIQEACGYVRESSRSSNKKQK